MSVGAFGTHPVNGSPPTSDTGRTPTRQFPVNSYWLEENDVMALISRTVWTLMLKLLKVPAEDCIDQDGGEKSCFVWRNPDRH